MKKLVVLSCGLMGPLEVAAKVAKGVGTMATVETVATP